MEEHEYALMELETVTDPAEIEEKKMMLNYYGHILKQPRDSQYVPYNIAQQFRGDFYGIMNSLGIAETTWFTNMLLNGMRSPEEYDGEAGLLYTIDSGWLERLLERSSVNIANDPFAHTYDVKRSLAT